MSKNLGETLRMLRAISTLTLRQVEEATHVSNAYLSQLENNKIKKPSANVLFKLANIYGVSIDVLLIAANIIKADEKQKDYKNPFPPLTESEEEQLLEYLKFLRTKDKKL